MSYCHVRCQLHGFKLSLMNGLFDLFSFLQILQAGLCLTRPVVPGNVVENPDQPSPISVLEPPFEEDDNIIQESSLDLKPDHLGISPPSLSVFFYGFL